MKILWCIIFLVAFLGFNHTTLYGTESGTNLKTMKTSGNTEWESAVKYAQKYKKTYKRENAGGYSLIAIGAASILTGCVFLGVTRGGGIILAAPFWSIGLTLISSGLILRSSADYKLLTSEEFNKISILGDHPDIDAYQFYETSGIKRSVKKNASYKFRTNGIILTSISIPLFALAIGGFVGSAQIDKENREESDDQTMDEAMGSMGAAFASVGFFILGISSIVPAVLILSGGITLLSISSSWKRLGAEPALTLNSISPIIDPVSRTYGLSAGFSF
ncbi:MAG TPA: hypothetical protein PLD55_07590 [bacterium]|nr:hypothetical protein [bacterium]HPM45738.1 hypothetical protein [bacterium]HPV21355.1 hypothetical protein [bacterium]HPY14453.1 hypothetical protein [bacterium]HQB10242.1 hypothetical protein [bacterium]